MEKCATRFNIAYCVVEALTKTKEPRVLRKIVQGAPGDVVWQAFVGPQKKQITSLVSRSGLHA